MSSGCNHQDPLFARMDQHTCIVAPWILSIVSLEYRLQFTMNMGL